MLVEKIRHVPIVNNQDQFVGLVTKRDVLAASVSALADLSVVERNELESGIPLSQIMITEVVIAKEETSLFEAAQFMLKQKHGCLPIFRNSKIIGILTEADFVRLSIYLMEKYEQTTDKD